MDTVKLVATTALGKSFGGLEAVSKVDFSLDAGEVRAIIGPNGAGKTTFVSMLSGRIFPTEGTVSYQGQDVTTMPAWKRVRLGIAYTFQITSIYASLTAFENVAIACRYHTGHASHDSLSRRVMGCLERTGLGAYADHRGGELAYGHQRLLEIAMGLALEPRLLILDEPTQGLSDGEIENFESLVKDIRQTGTILLIEHNMPVVMNLADRITVLDRGRVLAEGSPAEIQQNEAVQAAYLGG